jgi:hypothetical protein
MKSPEVGIRRWVFGKKCSEAGKSIYQNQYKTSNKKIKVCSVQEVQTNRTTRNNKLSTIIRDNEKENSLLPEKTISGEGHVIKKSRKLL